MTRAKKEFDLKDDVNQMTGGLSQDTAKDKLMIAMSSLEKRFTAMQTQGTVLHFIDELCMSSLIDSSNSNRNPD